MNHNFQDTVDNAQTGVLGRNVLRFPVNFSKFVTFSQTHLQTKFIQI